MSKKITITITATLRRAAPDTCNKFGKPLGTYELIDSNEDRVCWIDGGLSEKMAEMKAYDELAEPLLVDGYNLD